MSSFLQKVPPRFEELESVRGIAALLVVIHHIPQWNTLLYNIPYFRNGYLMVELFFVLSGFVIYTAYFNKITNNKDFVRFQFLRFGRLYPLHILFLLVFLGLEFLKLFASKYYNINSPNSTPFVINNFPAFISHLFLVQAIGVLDHVGSFNAPSWSISAEFYTYLLFGFIILKYYRLRVLLFTLLAIGFYLLSQSPVFSRFSYFFICISGFSLGCIVASCVSLYDKVKLPSTTPFIPIVLLLFLLANYPISTYYPLIFILSAILIFSLAKSKEGVVSRFLKNRLLKWLGLISYSIYMSHFLIIWIVNQFIRVILNKKEVLINGDSFPQLDFSESIIAYLITIVITLLVSYLIYRIIEKPFREKSRIFILKNTEKIK